MTEIIKPPMAGMTWEDKVGAEAMQFVVAVQRNFQHGLETSLKHLPDPNKAEYRATQIDFFFDAMVGLTVQILCRYGDTSLSPAFENVVVQKIQEKFQYIRDKEAEAKKPKLVEPLNKDTMQ